MIPPALIGAIGMRCANERLPDVPYGSMLSKKSAAP
jgi:hypothetical protein